MTPENTPDAAGVLERSFGQGITTVDHGDPRRALDRKGWAPIPWSEGIGERVHQALDVESVLADVPEAVGIEDYLGKSITIYGAAKVLGKIDDRDTVYVAIDATDDETGERIVITTGAEYVMHQLGRFYSLDAFPVTCSPFEQKLGVKGRNDPIHLGPVGRKDPSDKGAANRRKAAQADDENPF